MEICTYNPNRTRSLPVEGAKNSPSPSRPDYKSLQKGRGFVFVFWSGEKKIIKSCGRYVSKFVKLVNKRVGLAFIFIR